MIEYYLASYRSPDGSVTRRTIGGGSQAEALRLAKGVPPDARVEHRDAPSWDPAVDRDEDIGKPVNPKAHFLGGGQLICDYRGRSYIARPEFWGQDRRVVDETGRRIVSIGTVTFRCREAPGTTRTIHLEPLDEQHADDRLASALIEWDDEIAAPRPGAPSTVEGRSDGIAMGLVPQVRSLLEAELVSVLSREALRPGEPVDPETLLGETIWGDLAVLATTAAAGAGGRRAIAALLDFDRVDDETEEDGLSGPCRVSYLAGDESDRPTILYDHAERTFLVGSIDGWLTDRTKALKGASKAVRYWSQEYGRRVPSSDAEPPALRP